MLNLTSSVLFLDGVLLMSEAEFVISSVAGCKAVAIILHFAVFSCLSWMMNDAVYIYLAIAKVIRVIVRS